MKYQYGEYLKKEKVLTLEEELAIHNEIIKEIGTDPDALELYDELVLKSIEYSAIRAKWTLMNTEEKMDMDESRTNKHNSLIVKFNQLARYLKMKGMPAIWRDLLGYEEEDKINRKRIGDMGCFIAFVHGINAR